MEKGYLFAIRESGFDLIYWFEKSQATVWPFEKYQNIVKRVSCPFKKSWGRPFFGEEFEEATCFFTDVCKLNNQIDIRVFLGKLNLSITVRLPDYCCVNSGDSQSYHGSDVMNEV